MIQQPAESTEFASSPLEEMPISFDKSAETSGIAGFSSHVRLKLLTHGAKQPLVFLEASHGVSAKLGSQLTC